MNDNWNIPIKRISLGTNSPNVSPFSAVQKQFVGLLDDFLSGFGDPLGFVGDGGNSKVHHYVPRLEVIEGDSGIVLRAEVPGM